MGVMGVMEDKGERWGLGIYYDSSNNSNNEENTISNIIGGLGGLGGNGSDGTNAAGDGVGQGGGSGGASGAGGDGGSGVGIFANNSININSTLNDVVNITGANGNMAGSAGSGGTGLRDSGGYGEVGGNGGNGGNSTGLWFDNCQNINNQWNKVSNIIAGDGVYGSNGGDGGDGDLQGVSNGNGDDGGNGGFGGSGGAAFGLYISETNYSLNNGNTFNKIIGGDGADGGSGGNGGDCFDQNGGDSGAGGNGGDSKNGTVMYFSASNNITNINNILSDASGGQGGINGSVGIPGFGGTPGSPGVSGTSGLNSTGYGFNYQNSESSESWQNKIYILNNTDIGGKYNDWNSSTIGNFWGYYTGIDVAPPFGIGDVSYNLTGSSGSKDWLPIVDSSAPNVTINQPVQFQIIPNENNVIINATITDEIFITAAKAMINSTIPFNLTLTKMVSSFWIASWDNFSQYPLGDYNITIWVKDWKNNINNKVWVIIQSTDITPPQVVINNPTDGSSFEPLGSLSIPLSVNVSDTYGIASVKAQINASTPFNISLPMFIEPTYQLTWNNYTDLTYLPGDYRITFIATDPNGNVNSTESVVITVVKDFVGPNIIINSPNNESVYRSPVNIRVFVNDPEGNNPNAGDVIATIYNGTMIPFNLALTNTILNQWDVVWSNLTTNYYPGNYYINITAYDSSYYHNINKSVGFLNITYEYDTTAPIINFLSINDNTTVITTSNYTFSVNIIDENQPQFRNVLFEVSANSSLFSDTMTSLGGGNWEYIWNNISSYSNGKYFIRAFAIDSAPGANSNWSLTWEITIKIVTDEVDDNDFALFLSAILTFLTSTTGMITIGVGSALIAVIIIKKKRRGYYKPSSKDIQRIEEYRKIFKKDKKSSS